VHDSGKPQEFVTGAVRDTNATKARPDLISPFALWRLGEWLRTGAEKYTERNWEKGIPLSRCLASLVRHTLQYMMRDRSEDHLAAVMCNAMFMLHYEEAMRRGVLPSELNDLPSYRPTIPEAAVDDATGRNIPQVPAVFGGF